MTTKGLPFFRIAVGLFGLGNFILLGVFSPMPPVMAVFFILQAFVCMGIACTPEFWRGRE